MPDAASRSIQSVCNRETTVHQAVHCLASAKSTFFIFGMYLPWSDCIALRHSRVDEKQSLSPLVSISSLALCCPYLPSYRYLHGCLHPRFDACSPCLLFTPCLTASVAKLWLSPSSSKLSRAASIQALPSFLHFLPLLFFSDLANWVTFITAEGETWRDSVARIFAFPPHLSCFILVYIEYKFSRAWTPKRTSDHAARRHT